MSFVEELLKDRYACFEKYREKSPFFDAELNAHIILDLNDAMEILKRSGITANRKQQQMNSLKACPYSGKISDFYSKWLMYMEGEEHTRLRKLVFSALSDSMDNIESIVFKAFIENIIPVLSSKNNNVEFISNVVSPFIIDILSSVFGVDRSMYSKIISSSKPIVSFISSGSLGSDSIRKEVINSLLITENIIDLCIKDCDLSTKSTLANLINQKVEVNDIRPLLINILIDGYDPLISAVSQFFYLISKEVTMPNDIDQIELFNEIIRLEPAFQYCARIALENIHLNGYTINKGGRFMAFISSSNRDPENFIDPNSINIRSKKNKHISFGIGKHRCIGAILSQKIMTNLIKLIKQHNQGKLSYISSEWTNNIGFRALEKLYIEVKK